jgi:hypothetical protein
LARDAVWFIIGLAGQAPHRRARVTSNVRPAWGRWCPSSSRLAQVGSPHERHCSALRLGPLRSLLSVVACTVSGRDCACLQSQAVGCVHLHDVRTIFSHGAVLFALRAHGARTALLRLRCLGAPCTLPPAGRPNPSVEARPNGVALGPPAALVHHAPVGPSATPLVPPHLER